MPAAVEEVKLVKKIVKTGVAASGVGMPKAEKAFLASFANSNKGASSGAIQAADGLINLTTVTSISPTNAGPTASYQTPTLSYSWRLATRRKSTTAMNMEQAASAAMSSSPRHLRSSSPLTSRREWSPPPRSRPSPMGSGNRNSSPSRSSNAPAANPTDSLGLDKAIERLQSNIAPRAGRRSSIF